MDTHLESFIKKNYEDVCERISKAASRSNRKPEVVKVIVVTKKQPLEKIKAAINIGINILGENYPEEAEQKIKYLVDNKELEWHMIGHLQSRKIPIVCQYFSYLHSLDSLEHADKLNHYLDTIGKTLSCLLEFNLANEQTKSGWKVNALSELENVLPEIQAINNLQRLKIIGLMSMPPLFNIPEKTRLYVIQLREIRDHLANVFPKMNCDQLSIGTSFDYQIAIEEGSTMVRIGEAILGPRDYHII